jgi:uncharacterized membrane-anchored protein
MSERFAFLKKLVLAGACLFALGHSPAYAAGTPPAKQGDGAAAPKASGNELQDAFTAARAVLQRGPAEVKLRDQATFKVPAGFVFIPAEQSARILRAMGNRSGEDLLGLVFPVEEKANWFVVMQYEDSGYIKDDDAKDWNADDLLKSLKEGTEQSNADRRARGIPEMEVVGWVEKPHYDAAAHQLVWSVSSKDKGAPDTSDKGINYNTYALGREGYVTMNLVTDLQAIEAQKPIAKNLLAALEFNGGKRYTDFDASTDKVAAYGLAALVAGVAAKKIGLFALAAAFAVKFFKIIAVAVVAAGAAIGKLWKRKKDTTSA